MSPQAVRAYEPVSCSDCRAKICISHTNRIDRVCPGLFNYGGGNSDGRGRRYVGIGTHQSVKIVTTEVLLRDGMRVELLDAYNRVIETIPRAGRFDGVRAGKALFDQGLVLRLQDRRVLLHHHRHPSSTSRGVGVA
jgi:hypothetical protein